MDGPPFVLSHEAAIAFDIGAEDGSEFTLNILGGHRIPQRLVGRLV